MGAHMSKLGRSLDGAVKSYNETVGSLERQVLPQARRFEQHGITGVEPPELQPIDRQTRPLSAPELVGDAGEARSRSRSGRPTSALPRNPGVRLKPDTAAGTGVRLQPDAGVSRGRSSRRWNSSPAAFVVYRRWV